MMMEAGYMLAPMVQLQCIQIWYVNALLSPSCIDALFTKVGHNLSTTGICFRVARLKFIFLTQYLQLEDLHYRADLLESYIERRGAILPAGFMQQKVFLVSRDCRYGVCIMMCQCCEFCHGCQYQEE